MRRLMLLGSAAILAAGGCASQEGQAEPEAPSSSAAAAPEVPHSGAPGVDTPLPESALSGDPCGTLTSEQIEKALGNGSEQPERDDEESFGPACRWAHLAEGSSVVVGFQTATGEGLSSTYANAKPQVETFNEIEPVEGYPAVSYQRKAGSRMCTIMVGVSNQNAVSVTGTLGRDTDGDPCKPAQQVASWVVADLAA